MVEVGYQKGAEGDEEELEFHHHPCFLGSWKLWNSSVFEGASPNVQGLLQTIGGECSLWCMAGASKLSDLLARSLTPGAGGLATGVVGWSCFLFCHKHSLPCVCVGNLKSWFFLNSTRFIFFSSIIMK